MPSKTATQKKSLEDLEAERSRVAGARASIEAELEALDRERDAELSGEGEDFEEALRSGRPAKPHRKVRELRERHAELERQHQAASRALLRLEVETLELREEQAEKNHREAQANLEKAIEEAQKAEAKRIEYGNVAHHHYWEARDLRLALRHAKDRLAAADPSYAEELQRQHQASVPSREEIEAQHKVKNEQAAIQRLVDSGFYPVRDAKELAELQRAAGPSSKFRVVGQVTGTEETDGEG